MEFFNTIVVIPVGPKCRLEFIEDTIYSFIYHTRGSYKIVLADDSQKATGRKVQQLFPQADVVKMKRSMGKLCGLYVTLSLAFRHVLDNYRFDALLRLDTDALIIGTAPEQEAIQMFKQDAQTGVAGQYPFDYNGNPWDISWPQRQIKAYTGTYRFFRRPVTHSILWLHYQKALKNGYRTGESVFGGACFFSEACLRLLREKGLLPNYLLKDLVLEEDHLFSLLVTSVGMKLGDLATGYGPMGCAWLDLPASPLELLKGGKKIIHSVRRWKEMDEEAIRNFFRQRREEAVVFPSKQLTH
ncbi:MAG TPA: hypothetical protein VGB56_05745 [Flavisolibacter sp.]|jgi:hypothetical protein